MLSTLAFAGFIVSTMGHGRLTKPMTRIGNTGYENDPIGFGGRPAKQYICRHDTPNPSVTPENVNAGEKLTVQWVTTARHVGDCALYMSYDGDKALEDMRWFKIANKQNCKEYSGEDVGFDLPNWLPGGNAVLRWEWYALHVYPTIEFYAQCADIVVKPTSQAVSIDEIPTFKIFENGKKTSLPLDGEDGVGFRFPFDSNDQNWSPSNPSQFMTGPECVDESLNDCDLTAEGTQGHVALDTPPIGLIPSQSPAFEPTYPYVDVPTSPPGDLPTPAPVELPTPSPVELPTPAPVEPSQPPVEAPTQPPVHLPTQLPVFPPVTQPTQPPVDQPVTAPTEAPVDAPVTAPTYPPVVQPPVTAPTEMPVEGDCSGGLFDAYQQCDGEGFAVSNPDGCPLCPAGYMCYRRSKWYSNCNHSCPKGLGWDCETDAAQAPGAPESNGSDNSACPNGEYDTCGGFGQTALNCCKEGLVCTAMGFWHSQCMKPAL